MLIHIDVNCIYRYIYWKFVYELLITVNDIFLLKLNINIIFVDDLDAFRIVSTIETIDFNAN